jgi:phage gp37-like protein
MNASQFDELYNLLERFTEQVTDRLSDITTHFGDISDTLSAIQVDGVPAKEEE